MCLCHWRLMCRLRLYGRRGLVDSRCFVSVWSRQVIVNLRTNGANFDAAAVLDFSVWKGHTCSTKTTCLFGCQFFHSSLEAHSEKGEPMNRASSRLSLLLPETCTTESHH